MFHGQLNSSFEHIRSTLRERILQVREDEFNALALDVFRFQAVNNPLYAKYLELLGKPLSYVETVEQIPFLPLELFKSYDIQTGQWAPERMFRSSGTTGQTTSRHLLRDPDWYRAGARRAFARQYGPVENFCFLALLPSYLERNNSSLVFMAEDFISLSPYPQSGFYLYNVADLVKVISDCLQNKIPTVLLGVSFALLDLAEAFPMPLEPVIVMETGGMKGRREELTREQLHEVLRDAFRLQHIHSEYGMTELLSQAYSPENGRFYAAPTMRVLAREAADPFAVRPRGQNGALNIIDLANVDTLSFIATDDLGRVAEDGSFEVTGRLDSSEIRGCNLMVE